jgi:DNA-binding CsgD family transcriptional regulator
LKRATLTRKQLEYLSLLASGFTTLEIAQQCVVSHHTVRNTLTKAKERVKATSTTNLVALAVRKKWIVAITDNPPYMFRPRING